MNRSIDTQTERDSTAVENSPGSTVWRLCYPDRCMFFVKSRKIFERWKPDAIR
jgi:hypothetical protein